MYFIIFIIFVICQRLSELYISSRNEKWLRSQGAVQYGQKHYPFMVAMHTLFIVSMIIEYTHHQDHVLFYPLLLGVFILLLSFKFWVISSLGKFWNTKIYRIPGFFGVKKGPFKFLRHPNYIEVICEIIVIPMVFNLYYTAVVFTVLNALMLTVRIREENRVWGN
jgi:methyltransferase